MSSSRIITLFSERPEVPQQPAYFLVSIVAHIAAVALLSFGIIYRPELNNRIVAQKFTVRHLDLHTPQMAEKQPAGTGDYYPGPRANGKQPAAGPKQAAQQAVLRQIANAVKGPQTLVQADITDPVKLAEVMPLPTVVIWTPSKVLVKKVVAPLPEPATAAEVKPSLNAPNQEINLADVGVSSAAHPTEKLPVLPSTTLPLQVNGPKMTQMAPVSTSQAKQQPTPAAILSLSDLRMPNGIVTLPPVNMTADQNTPGALTAGQTAHGKESGQAQAGGKGTNGAAGQAASGKQSDQADGKGTNGAGGEPAPGKQSDQAGGPNGAASPASLANAGMGLGMDAGLTVAQITLPRDGQFGAVVVGASLEAKYPEMSGIWNERVAYTVYLHVGLARSWILQYSLPSAETAAAGGNVTRLEAPWPFNIVRPNIPPDSIEADALMVHGFVSQAGRFESLSIAFPPQFPQAQFVLASLKQWQFRPASRDGQPERVEVLLIIPEERDQALNAAPAVERIQQR